MTRTVVALTRPGPWTPSRRWDPPPAPIVRSTVTDRNRTSASPPVSTKCGGHLAMTRGTDWTGRWTRVTQLRGCHV